MATHAIDRLALPRLRDYASHRPLAPGIRDQPWYGAHRQDCLVLASILQLWVVLRVRNPPTPWPERPAGHPRDHGCVELIHAPKRIILQPFVLYGSSQHVLLLEPRRLRLLAS